MTQYTVTIEYVEGIETKIVTKDYEFVQTLLASRLDSDHAAKEVKRVTICPRHTP